MGTTKILAIESKVLKLDRFVITTPGFMISQQDHIKIVPQKIDCCFFVIPITNGIAKKKEFSALLFACINIRLFQRRRVRMRITHDRIFHSTIVSLGSLRMTTAGERHYTASAPQKVSPFYHFQHALNPPFKEAVWKRMQNQDPFRISHLNKITLRFV